MDIHDVSVHRMNRGFTVVAAQPLHAFSFGARPQTISSADPALNFNQTVFYERNLDDAIDRAADLLEDGLK